MEKINKSKEKNHKMVFRIQLMECAMVVISIIFSLAFAGKSIYNNSFPFGIIDGILIYAVISSAGVILLGMNRYFSFLSKGFVEIATKIFAIVVILNFIFIALLYFSKSLRLSPYYFVVADVFLFLFLFVIKRTSNHMKRSIMRHRLTLVIGKNKVQNPILRALKTENQGKLGFAPFDHPKLKKYLEQADNIYLSGVLSKKFKEQVITFCAMKDKRVFVVPETYEIAMRKSEMTQVDDIPVFSIDSFQLTSAQSIVKRFCDIVLALIGIVLCSPLMIFAIIRIKMEDGGPVFYKQERSGLKGKVFHVLKFRSMVVDAEKYTGAVFASEDDPRITKIGKLMRATRIDEIPQFFNVLAGSMSLVGPRPERPVFVEAFCKDLPEYHSRLAVKPGVTGLAQVMGNYTTSAYNKVKFDLVYIRDYSLWLDIKILFKTVQVVFRKEQAAGFSKSVEENSEIKLNVEEVFDHIFSPEKKRGSYLTHRIAKTLGVVFCCSIVIIGSVFLRYSALALTMMEAAIPEENADSQLIASSEIIDSQKNQDLAVEAFSTNLSVASKPIDLGSEEDSIVGSGNDILDGAISHDSGSEKKNLVLTSKEMEYAMSRITMTEKFRIGMEFLSKLNTADLMFLEKLAEGGFTVNEKEAAKTLMYERFNDDEVAYIKKVYREYVE